MTKLLIILSLLALPPVRATGQTRAAFDRKQVEGEVMLVLFDFMAAFNRQDAVAEARTYHFPHYRLASGRMTVLNAADAETAAALNATYKAFRESGWDHSAWANRRVIHISESKVHVDTRVTRYGKDGRMITSFESLYILTKENGRWGIKMRSSFAR